MSITNNTFKDLEELNRSMVESRKAWEDGKISPNRTDSYLGIWREMNHYRQFIENEQKDYDKRFREMGEVYNPSIVAEHKNRFKDDFSKMTIVVIATFHKMITEFTKKKHEQVTKMVRTAPSESMLNLLETLKLRDDLDTVELHDIMPVFYENYHGIRALQAIGRQNGIMLNVPVQMDCTSMHSMIDEAKDFLLGACNEMFKPKTHTTRYNSFFTVNENQKDKVYSPEYEKYVKVLDYVPQLQDFIVTKTSLTPVEKAKIEWYYRDLSENATKTEIAMYTKNVMEKHPEDIGLLKLSNYSEYVETVELSLKDAKIRTRTTPYRESSETE